MTRPFRRLSIAVLLSAPMLASCANHLSSRVPSLLPRTAERRDDLEPVRPTPVATPDPALDAQIAELTPKIAANRTAFDAVLAKAQSAVASARGSAVGSDPWLDAQRTLGALDVARSDNLTLAAAVDRIAVDRAAKGLPDYPALSKLRADLGEQLAIDERKVADVRSQIAS